MGYLDELVARDPGNVAAAMQRGLVLLTDDPERAYADLSASIERVGEENARPLRQARIDVLNAMGRTDEVASELEKLLADDPNDPKTAANAVRFYLGAGDAAAAERVLRSAVEADPEDPQALFSLAQFQSRTLGKPDLAERTLTDFLNANPENREAKVMLGTFYEGVGRVDDARGLYRQVIEAAPDSEEALAARNRIAATLALAGDNAAAVSELDAVLAADPGNAAAQLLLGEIAFAEGRFTEAVSQLRGAVRESPGNEAALLLLARSHAALGEQPLAEDVYRRVLEVSPANTDALAELAVSLQNRGQVEEAEALYRRLLAADENSLVARSGLVETAIAQREYDVAESAARGLIDIGDPRGVGSIQLGKVLQAREDFPAAAAAFEDALLRDAASQLALKGLVGSWTSAGELERAGSAAERFLAANPENLSALILLGGNLLRRGEPEAARVPLEQALAREPRSVQAWIILSSSYPGDADQRIAVLRRGLDAVPAQPDLTVLLGGAYTRQGRPDDAIAVYERSLAENPDARTVANNLASLLLEVGDDAGSRQRALEIARGFSDSRDPAQLDTLGWAYFHNGEPRRAVEFLERALALGGDLPIVNYHLASAYAMAGDSVGAERQLARFLEQVPANDPQRARAEAEVRRLMQAEAA